MILIYEKIPATKIKKQAKSFIKKINDWFTNNPTRKVCKTVMWHGEKYTIKRKDVKQQIDKIVDELTKK
jgi:hypothetical protein